MEKINLEKTFNTRDFGGTTAYKGKKIKSNRLIRSGHLHKINDHDTEKLKEHNLKIVVDFRAEKEFINLADVRIEGVKYINLPALKNLNGDSKSNNSDSNLLVLTDKEKGGKKFLKQAYIDLVSKEEGIKAYREFFSVLQNNKDGAVLFHCSQGKDRAGLASFLIQYALGVSYEDSLKDYLMTNEAMDRKIERIKKSLMEESNNDSSRIQALVDVFHAYEEYLQASIDTIIEKYGSIDYFLKEILQVNIDEFRKNYLSE